MERMRIERRVKGMVRTNVYFLMNMETKEAVVIDPADAPQALQRDLDSFGVKPVGILLTHGHFDHIGAARELADLYGIPICAGREEEGLLEDAGDNLSTEFGRPLTVKADRLFADGEVFEMAGFTVRVFHTPGHTRGGVCYYLPQEKTLFSGDTLFHESVGRTDFPTGSMRTLVDSVRRLIRELPEDTAVYPGHESETSIGHEKEYNPFI